MSDDEESPGGSKMLRHEVRHEGWTPPAEGVEGAAEAVEARMSRHIGPVESVFHEIVSDLVHVDVHFIPATDERPHHVLFTTGMGDLPMHTPDGADVESRAELMLALPADWELSEDALQDERWYWPIRWLKVLARLPHQYDTWLGVGHTVPNGDPPEPYAPGVPFCCAMIAPPLLLPQEAQVLTLANGEQLRMLSVVWLHPGEVMLKLNKGSDALFDRLDEVGASEPVDLRRRDVSRRKKLFGLF